MSGAWPEQEAAGAWAGMIRRTCPTPGPQCLSCDRRGWHLEPAAPADVELLEQLAKDATAAPWEFGPQADTNESWLWEGTHHSTGDPDAADTRFGSAQTVDARLIVAMHRALPFLIAEVRRHRCPLPPVGWWCSKAKGHDGPCPTRPLPQVDACNLGTPGCFIRHDGSDKTWCQPRADLRGGAGPKVAEAAPGVLGRGTSHEIAKEWVVENGPRMALGDHGDVIDRLAVLIGRIRDEAIAVGATLPPLTPVKLEEATPAVCPKGHAATRLPEEIDGEVTDAIGCVACGVGYALVGAGWFEVPWKKPGPGLDLRARSAVRVLSAEQREQRASTQFALLSRRVMRLEEQIENHVTDDERHVGRK